MIRKTMGGLVKKVSFGVKIAGLAGTIGLSGLLSGCDMSAVDENAMMSALASGNAQLAAGQGNYQKAAGWNTLANLSGGASQRQHDLDVARAGRSQVNVYNGRNEGHEQGDYLVVYNSKTGKNEKWNEIPMNKFKEEMGLPQESNIYTYNGDLLHPKPGLKYMTLVVSYNYWIDLDGNGNVLKGDKMNFDELVGLGKHKFRSDEEINLLFLRDPENHDSVKYKLIGKGGKILSQELLPDANAIVERYNRPEDAPLHDGNYVASWEVNGKSINSWQFEVID